MGFFCLGVRLVLVCIVWGFVFKGIGCFGYLSWRVF